VSIKLITLVLFLEQRISELQGTKVHAKPPTLITMFGGTDDSKSIELAEKQLVEQQNLVARITSIEQQLKKLNEHFNPTKQKPKHTKISTKTSTIGAGHVVYCRFNWFGISDLDLQAHTFTCTAYFEATWEIDQVPEKDTKNNYIETPWEQYEGWVSCMTRILLILYFY